MAEVKGLADGFTKGETALIKALYNGNGEKTVAEIAASMPGKSNGEERKAGSVTTAIAQLRARFRKDGKKFELKGRSLEPKHVGGGGRTAERIDLDDVEALCSDD